MITKVIISYKISTCFANLDTESMELTLANNNISTPEVLSIDNIDGIYVVKGNKMELITDKKEIKDYFADYKRILKASNE